MKVDSAAKKNTTSKDEVRESLHMLQPSATDKQNLDAAERMLRSTKQTKEAKTENIIPEKTKSSFPNNKSKKITFEDKAVQTAQEVKIKIEVDNLTSTDIITGPSENDWEVLADRQQIALDDALEKIGTLEERIEKLQKQNEKLKEQKLVHEDMLKETRAFVEVLQQMIESDGNGTNNSLDDSIY